MHFIAHPPKIRHALTWRSLYVGRAFAQRELMPSSTFRSRARDRGTGLGISDKQFEYFHQVGALRPLAFSRGPYWTGFTSPSEPAEQLVFTDEQADKPWSDYEYELHDRPQVTALYTPWHHLFTHDAVRAGTFPVPLWVLSGQPDKSTDALEQLRGWAQAQDTAWRALDDEWRALLQVLVRLQNRYWPELTNRITLLSDPESGERYDPFPRECACFDPKHVLDRDLGGDRDGILAAYQFLVDRGIDLDPRDGLTMLRRARRRELDAADVLRRFLVDVDGCQPPQPEAVPLDGRQDVRAALYARGPGARWDAQEVVARLQEADLYPHGVHIVHEGDTDELLITSLITEFIGSAALEEVNFTDLQGAGNAGIVEDLVKSLEGYARRTVVIVDNEAKALAHVQAMIAAGSISADDALIFETSLEAANASLEELVDLTVGVAADHAVSLSLTYAEVDVFHAAAIRRATERRRESPSLSTSLERVVSRASGGEWHLRKPELVAALARHLADESDSIAPAESARPLVRFVATRIIPPLLRAYPVGPS